MRSASVFPALAAAAFIGSPAFLVGFRLERHPTSIWQVISG
jgi:hypothetical protein